MKHGNVRQMMTRLVPGAAIIACVLVSLPATAEVYKWTDENGVTHYTETPPPSDYEAELQELEEFERTETPALEPNENLSGEELSAADLRRQEMAAAHKARAEDQALAEQLCQDARERLEAIEPSRRVYYTDENGETVRMDDEARVAEIERIKALLDENCQ